MRRLPISWSRAVMEGADIEIVHGIGTGRLRRPFAASSGQCPPSAVRPRTHEPGITIAELWKRVLAPALGEGPCQFTSCSVSPCDGPSTLRRTSGIWQRRRG